MHCVVYKHATLWEHRIHCSQLVSWLKEVILHISLMKASTFIASE